MLGTTIQRGKRTTLTDMALVAKDEMNEGVKRVGLTPGRKLRNAGNFRGASFDLKGTQNPVALMRYRTAFPSWFEYGTKTHAIVTRKVGGPKRSRGQMPTGPGMFGGRRTYITGAGRQRTSNVRGAGAVRTPQGMRAYARHPGMKPRPFWQGTKRRAMKAVPEVARQGLRRNIVASGWGR